MSQPLEFYFDFISPFAYLAHPRVCEVADRFGLEVQYRPIDLAKAKLAAGNTGPSNRQIPAKARYMTTDLRRWAGRHGMPLTLPRSFVTGRANLGTLFAVSRGQGRDYVQRVFDRAWGRGGDFDDATLASIAAELGWRGDELLDFVASDEAARQYEAVNQQAHAKGVFGVPTMLLGDEMWWGNDRVDFLREHLESAMPAQAGKVQR